MKAMERPSGLKRGLHVPGHALGQFPRLLRALDGHEVEVSEEVEGHLLSVGRNVDADPGPLRDVDRLIALGTGWRIDVPVWPVFPVFRVGAGPGVGDKRNQDQESRPLHERRSMLVFPRNRVERIGKMIRNCGRFPREFPAW